MSALNLLHGSQVALQQHVIVDFTVDQEEWFNDETILILHAMIPQQKQNQAEPSRSSSSSSSPSSSKSNLSSQLADWHPSNHKETPSMKKQRSCHDTIHMYYLYTREIASTFK